EDGIRNLYVTGVQTCALPISRPLNHSPGLDSEGADRKDLKLPYGQDELIRRVVEANPRTVVVLLGGGPVEMGPWLARVPAVLQRSEEGRVGKEWRHGGATCR